MCTVIAHTDFTAETFAAAPLDQMDEFQFRRATVTVPSWDNNPWTLEVVQTLDTTTGQSVVTVELQTGEADPAELIEAMPHLTRALETAARISHTLTALDNMTGGDAA